MPKSEFLFGFSDKEVDLEKLSGQSAKKKRFRKSYVAIALLTNVLLYSVSLLYIFDRPKFNNAVGAVIGGVQQNAAAGDPKTFVISLVFMLAALLMTRILIVELSNRNA